MALERVSGVGPTPPLAAPRGDTPGRQALTPGQVLLVKVVGTTPQLELAVLDTAPRPAPATADEAPAAQPQGGDAADTAALQPDQARLQRLIRQAPDAPALAARWRTLVAERLQQAGVVVDGTDRADMGGMGDEEPLRLAPQTAARADSPTGDARLAAAERTLLFPAGAWPGLSLHFWLVNDPLAGLPGRRRSRLPPARLHLALDLPGLGPVRLDVELVERAVALQLTAAQLTAVPLLRSRVTLLAARLAGCGLRLVRCHADRGTVAAPVLADPDAALREAWPAAAWPPALFRAAAETLAALSPPFR